VTLAPKGLLIEEQRTNLVLRSEGFDNAYWSKSRSTVTSNTIIAPDGTQTADKLIEDTTASNTHRIFNETLYTATTHTWSIYCKAAERTFCYLRLTNPFIVGVGAYFNLATGAIGTIESGVTAAITAAGNGWFRCSITVSTSAVPTPYVGIANADGGQSYTGDGTSGIYIWGAQLE
jgi:hypothetical protein